MTNKSKSYLLFLHIVTRNCNFLLQISLKYHHEITTVPNFYFATVSPVIPKKDKAYNLG